ncbi:uncharacterized protein LOC126677770 [Mercurialis annua]|uniref:uncharacterized protein LOC126677770 n=1 Tax=Mercurialis annua TaxID=3986 RepID=UPI00215EC531|nr:uncharacterized protein LOC126677770 [Mercurialis annua]
MTTIDLSFLIWCDGSIVHSPRGVEYFGGRYVHAPLSERMNFQELVNICRTAVSTTMRLVDITKIYFRVPHVQGNQIHSYSLFDVQCDQHVFAILGEAARLPTLKILEFYVEYLTSTSNDIPLDQLDLVGSSESERESEKEEEEHHYEKTNTWKYDGSDTCDMLVAAPHHQNFGINQIASFIRTQVLGQHDIRIKTLIAGIFETFGVTLPYKRTWYGKEREICNVYGDWEYNYTQLTKFMDNLVLVNPGSFWHAEGPRSECDGIECRIFKRMFWTFFPMVDGFRFCKPVLFVDGTHLYGKYKMHMLIASAIDGNNHIMPVAFALVGSKTTASYEYFLGHLQEQVIRDRKVAIVSDRVGGIISVLKRPEWDGVDHFFCMRHLMANFHTLIENKDLKKLAEKAGRAFQEKKYTRYMDIIKNRSAAGYAYLTNEEHLKKEQWTMSGDIKGKRNGVMTTNYAVSVNATLKNIRGLPITAMLEAIFDKLVDMFAKRWEMYKGLIARGVQFTPICFGLMKKAGDKSRTHSCQKYNPNSMTCKVITRKDHLREKGGNTQKVNLRKRTCTCGKFQQRKLPCSHAMAVIYQEKLNPHDFIGWRYQTKMAIQAWDSQFIPLCDREYWIGSQEVPFIPDVDQIRKNG